MSEQGIGETTVKVIIGAALGATAVALTGDDCGAVDAITEAGADTADIAAEASTNIIEEAHTAPTIGSPADANIAPGNATQPGRTPPKSLKLD